jgi:trimeric autotransporter adhesin
MNSRIARLGCVAPLIVFISACSSSSPLQPSIGAPRPLQPANGTQVSNASQPVTLVVANAITTGASTLSYTFEVATDAAFTNKVATSTSVAQGANGQTSMLLGTLGAGSDYYWHASAGATGVFSAASKFTIGPAIVIHAPTPVAPLNGTTTSGWPTFTVNDAARSGPAAPLVYRFDVATSADFSTIVLTATVSETANQTSFTPGSSQQPPPQNALFWRALAIDPVNVIASAPSAPQSFT